MRVGDYVYVHSVPGIDNDNVDHPLPTWVTVLHVSGEHGRYANRDDFEAQVVAHRYVWLFNSSNIVPTRRIPDEAWAELAAHRLTE